MKNESVEVLRHQNIAELQFSNGKANLLSIALLDKMILAMEALNVDSSIQIIFVRGLGKTFSTGIDLVDIRKLQEPGRLKKMRQLEAILSKNRNGSKIYIALINGLCLGGGLELALSCHLRIATKRSKLGFPEINYGLFPGINGMDIAPEILGRDQALLWILSGEIYDAEFAYSQKLISKLVNTDEDLTHQVKYIQNIVEKIDGNTISFIKDSIFSKKHQTQNEANILFSEILDGAIKNNSMEIGV